MQGNTFRRGHLEGMVPSDRLLNDAVLPDEVYEERAGVPTYPHRRSSKDSEISASGMKIEKALERSSLYETFGGQHFRRRKGGFSRIHEETVTGDLMWPTASGPWNIPVEVKRRVSRNLDQEEEKLAERRQSNNMWIHHSGENNVLLNSTGLPWAGERVQGPKFEEGANVLV